MNTRQMVAINKQYMAIATVIELQRVAEENYSFSPQK